MDPTSSLGWLHAWPHSTALTSPSPSLVGCIAKKSWPALQADNCAPHLPTRRFLSAETFLARVDGFQDLKIGKATYRISTRPQYTWEGARAACRSMGMDLATFASRAAAQAVHGRVKDLLGTNVSYWLGASDASKEGSWTWVSGQAVNHTRWLPGEPNGGRRENCLAAAPASAGWLDAPCNSTLAALCGSDTPGEIHILSGAEPHLLAGHSLCVEAGYRLPVELPDLAHHTHHGPLASTAARWPATARPSCQLRMLACHRESDSPGRCLADAWQMPSS